MLNNPAPFPLIDLMVDGLATKFTNEPEPGTVIEPVTVSEPLNTESPTTLNSTAAEEESVNEPVTIWFPTNVFEPVVANPVPVTILLIRVSTDCE